MMRNVVFREKMKRFLRMFFAVSMVNLFWATANITMAEVCINALPEDITIREGNPLDLPVFFWGSNFTGKPIELLVWKETTDTQSKEYLNPDGWVSFSDGERIKPILTIKSMIEYANIMWRVFERTDGMRSFTLNICMKDVETRFETCGQQRINITPAK